MRRGGGKQVDHQIFEKPLIYRPTQPIARRPYNLSLSWVEALREGEASLSSVLRFRTIRRSPPSRRPVKAASAPWPPSKRHAASQRWCDLEVNKGTPTTFESDNSFPHAVSISLIPYTRWRGPYTMARHKHIRLGDAKVIDLYSCF